MIQTSNPQTSVENLLRRVVHAQSNHAIHQLTLQFQHTFAAGYPWESLHITPELSQLYMCAQQRIKTLDQTPEQLSDILLKIRDLVLQSLCLNPVIKEHLREAFHDESLSQSLVDHYLSAANDCRVSHSDIAYLITSDWGGNAESNLGRTSLQIPYTVPLFATIIATAAEGNLCTQADLWSSHRIGQAYIKMAGYLAQPPLVDKKFIENLKRAEHPEYIPIGYSTNHLFFKHLLALDFHNERYRLRLLTSDDSHLLAVNKKPEHYCPEVIWEGLTIDQINRPEMWKSLFEANAYTVNDVRGLADLSDLYETVIAYNSMHVVPWLTRQLGQQPRNVQMEVEEECWKNAVEERPWNKVGKEKIVTTLPPSSNSQGQQHLMLASTGMDIKRTVCQASLNKFINLIAKDRLNDYRDLQLFKAESRLLMLAGAFETYKNHNLAPDVRDQFLKTIRVAWGKVTSPLIALLKQNLTEAQRSAAEIVLISTLDLQRRYTEQARKCSLLTLTAVHPLYPVKHERHRLDFSQITFKPVVPTILNVLRLDQDTPPLELCKQWTRDKFPNLHHSLECWYDVLLDAKQKCEPVEILMMAHRNLFSRLPIPSTGQVKDTFPDEVSEGLLVGTLILIKKIVSLVFAEVLSGPFIPPLFIADLTRAYRFAVELLRYSNPRAQTVTISWFCLQEYMNSRHSFHSPGEVRKTLEQLVESFRAISPNGYLQSSEDYKEIPLFYYSWKTLPFHYALHRDRLGPPRKGRATIEEILMIAELGDQVNMKPEETDDSHESVRRWENSFTGQTFIATEEIAQHYTLSILSTAEDYRGLVDNQSYHNYAVSSSAGPDDHSKLVGFEYGKFIYSMNNYFEWNHCEPEVPPCETQPEQRLVQFHDKQIKEIITKLSTKHTDEWISQAELLKQLDKRDIYHLFQSARGASTLSIDVLLEFFETRFNLLLNSEYRTFFLAIMRSAHVFETSCESEPHLIERVKNFIREMYHEDRLKLSESPLHMDRLLWVLEIIRLMCQMGNNVRQKFAVMLPDMLRDVQEVARRISIEERVAPHVLACQMHLDEKDRLNIIEMARLHVLVGSNPPHQPNDLMVWLDAAAVMQDYAPKIQDALLNGEKALRRQLLSLVLNSEPEVEEALKRQWLTNDLAPLLKAQMDLGRHERKRAYLDRWKVRFATVSIRDYAWREEATERLANQLNSSLKQLQEIPFQQVAPLMLSAQKAIVATKTTCLMQIAGKPLMIDWMTGRVFGQAVARTRLPVFMRKHEDFKPLCDMLQRPLETCLATRKLKFKGIEHVLIDVDEGMLWLVYQQQQLRLLSHSQRSILNLPDFINDHFTVWVAETRGHPIRGVIALHDETGCPHPRYTLDQSGNIHMIEGNPDLSLATSGFYSEAQLFSRWKLEQKDLLVWLDQDNRVAELHVPLDNGHKKLTRVIRMDNGEWWLDGMDLILEETKEDVAAFLGFPVYLIARNAEQQRFILLSSAAPFVKGKDNEKFSFTWDKVLSGNFPNKIHQYRLFSNGDIQGLTVANNLLLMLWKFWMRDFSSAADLAKRWLTPPGRAYSEEEQDILLNWFSNGFKTDPIINELHPSALSLRVYVIAQVRRHVLHFPPPKRKGDVWGTLTQALAGKRGQIYQTVTDLNRNLLSRQTLHPQIRGTHFRELVSAYDHESIFRMLASLDRLKNRPLLRDLYARTLEGNKWHSHHEGAVRLTYKIANKGVIECGGDGRYVYSCLADAFPSQKQTHVVPVDALYKNGIFTELALFFDRAYTLIKEGPRNGQEHAEYDAIVYCIQTLNHQKQEDFCVHQLRYLLMEYSDEIAPKNIILWLILSWAWRSSRARKALPQLPSVDPRFGLSLKESVQATRAFFDEIIMPSGKTVPELFVEYTAEWKPKRVMRVVHQSTVYREPPQEFTASLFEPYSPLLLKEIRRWSSLTHPKPVQSTEAAGIGNIPWTYAVPTEWSGESLTDLLPKMLQRIDLLTQVKSSRQKSLLSKANVLPSEPNQKLIEFANQVHYKTPYDVDECIARALSGKDKIQLEVVLYLEAAIELAHLQRCKKELEECLGNPANKDRLIQFRETLMTPHRYALSDENLPLMISEYYSDCLLRVQPDQAQHVDYLCAETGDKGCVVQAIMGSGKSKMIAPVWLQKMLSRGRIPILCVPSSLFRTTLSDLQEMMWKRFKTHVRSFTFEREKCTKEYLYNLAETLYMAQLQPTVFVCATRDLHAIQLMLKERHQLMEDMRDRLKKFTMKWIQTALPPATQETINRLIIGNEWQQAYDTIPNRYQSDFKKWFDSHTELEKQLAPLAEEANLLQAILNHLRFESALLVDEVANAWDPRNLLSFPIGWQIQANPNAVSIGCKLYFDWLAPHYEELGLLNNMQNFSKEATRQAVYLKIAAKAWEYYQEHIPNLPNMDIFTAYLHSKPIEGAPMEAIIFQLDQHPRVLMRQFAQELCYLKYCLTVGLEGALTSTGHVNYGRSIQDRHLYLAIPYQHANVPKENTLFKRPWKTILMTCQLYAQGWHDPKQTMELITFLQGIDPNSKDSRTLEAALTVWGRRFSGSNLMDEKEAQELTGLLESARGDALKGWAARLLISTYLKACVFPSQLKLDPSQLTSTSQDIPHLSAKTDAMGGTFGFEMTWSPSLKRRADHSSDETILKALKETRNQLCHVIPKGGAEAFFAFLQTGLLKELIALIDAGALFKGINNEKVAERLFSIYKTFGFDCVLFYDETLCDGARLAVMGANGKTVLEVSDKDGVKRALGQMKLSRPFVYFDQARRIGADLELKNGRAGVTFSDTVTLDDLLQSCMRCRGFIVGRHSVEFLIPAEMEGEWTGDKVVAVSKLQKIQVEGNANFHGACEQMRAVLRSLVDGTMRQTADFEARHRILKTAQSFLMEEQTNDLVKTFGTLQGMISSAQALAHVKASLLADAERILPGKSEEVARQLDAVLMWHQKRGTVFPEFVRQEDCLDDAVQEVNLSKDHDRLRLMEEEYERMLGTRNPQKEVAWTVLKKEWVAASPLGTLDQGRGMPPLYYLKDALKERGHTIPISDEILISANLLSTFMGESNCLLTPNRKPVHRILCVPTWNKPTFVLVSEEDARQLKQLLLAMEPNTGLGYFLLEPNGVVNQRGCRKQKTMHLWNEGSVETRSLLLQAMCFQGAAMRIDKLLHNQESEVRNAMAFWTKKDPNRLIAMRVLFEAAADLCPDEMAHYLRSRKLRALFS
jgi:hypothetical protein